MRTQRDPHSSHPLSVLLSRVLPALILVGFVLACGTLKRAFGPVPGYGVDEELLEASGCDVGVYESALESFKSAGGYAMPRVGDHLCTIWAKLGVPDDSRMIQLESGNYLHFTYETGSVQAGNYDVHTLTFDCGSRGADCQVQSVNW